MGKCSLCPKTQSRLYPDGLCKGCHKKKSDSGNDDMFLGLTGGQLNDLPELPQNWLNEPFHNLTGGHLLNIIMQANSLLLLKINEIDKTIKDIKNDIEINGAKSQKNTESIKTNLERIDKQENETIVLKKSYCNSATIS